MKIGLIKEIKNNEYRVGLTPDCVREYVKHGHTVLVETNAGIGVGFSDQDYIDAGANITPDRNNVFEQAEMIVKVKEFIEEEYDLLRENTIVYTFLHLAAEPKLTEVLLKKNITAIAYETIMNSNGNLPCLTPMSAIAGRLAIQEGAKYLEKTFGGRGVLLGGVPGIQQGSVTIIGGGIVGINSCKMAVGLGAKTTILDISQQRLAYLDDLFGNRITTLYCNRHNLVNALKESDLVVGAVLIPGASAPKLVTSDDLKVMKPGAVIVDVAIDQGGCIQTSHVTTHDDPIYMVDGIVHYAVGNMPGAVALSSTIALTNITLEYGLEIANKGAVQALTDNKAILSGLNTYKGNVSAKSVADSLGKPCVTFK